ncbi:hypothetical protein CORC01_02156 [Colletotrichum orchidophilum]|uniref:Uncharacterized protein n=1 Tax=Colletotrichum orchidophilum TaxID=1209926 RepID=A0A1G4BLZ6_9PEZI|nr:uncharacterized protein CORC01_02156 [Colletotrichum orchidophilum]OHF02461.1 hypothetical protein CORC01_02156 [Colletotrichum orchidophilum]
MCNKAQDARPSGTRHLLPTVIAGWVSVMSSLILRRVILFYLDEEHEMRFGSYDLQEKKQNSESGRHLSAVVSLLLLNVYSISTYSFNFFRRNDLWKNRIIAGFFAISVIAAGVTTAALGDDGNSFADFAAITPLLLPLSLWFSTITHSIWYRWPLWQNASQRRPGDEKVSQ